MALKIRQYMSRKEGDKEHLRIEERVDASIRGLEDFI